MAKEEVPYEVLSSEYKDWVKKTRSEWLRGNRPKTTDVWEVMHDVERQKIYKCMSDWERYITPKAENWWERRGYGCIWPEDNSQGMITYKLENKEEVFEQLGLDIDSPSPVFYKTSALRA